MIINNKYLFFILIIITNIIIRSLYLDATPFWYDEMISVKDTQLDFGHIKHEAEWDNNPPFYYYCLWVWHSVIPVSEFNSRFLSVLFVSISIGLLYLFANKYFDNKTAISSVILLTVSNFIFFYSQEARAYSLVLLLSVISTIQFFKYIKDPIFFNLIILSLLNFLIIYTHYIAGLIVFIQYLIILFFHKPKYLSFFLIQSLIIIGLIFLRFTKKQFLNILNFNKKDDFWLQPAGIKDLLHGLSYLFYNSITAIIFVIIFLVFMYLFFKDKNKDVMHVKLYCLTLGFFSIFFLFLLGTFKPIFLPRYLIFSVPFATILIVNQLFKFNKAGLVVIILLIGFETFSINLVKKKSTDYRSVASTISQYKKPEDVVIINTRDNLGLFFYYINHEYLKIKNLDSLCSSNNIYGINDTLSLKQIKISKKANIFLVQSFHNLNNNINTFERYFTKRNKKEFSTNYFEGIEFTIFKK